MVRNKAIISSIALWIVYLISISYSHDLIEAWNIFPTKSALLVFPILFSPLILDQEKTITKIKLWFIYGCIFSVTVNIGFATYNYITEIIRINQNLYVENYGVNYFLSSRFSFLIHPSYWAMYLNWGLALLLFDASLKLSKLLKSIALILLLTGIILSASKAGLLSTLFILFLLVYRTIRKPNGYASYLKYIVFTLILIPFLLFKISPEYSSRFVNALNVFSIKSIPLNASDSNTLRLVSWNSSVELISENPIAGVGIGDARHELLLVYKAKNQNIALLKVLNSHNQFLQTATATGLIGLVLLLCICAFAIQIFNQTGNLPGLIFIVLIVINMLFESMLEAQAGIVFIMFWLICLITEQKSISE